MCNPRIRQRGATFVFWLFGLIGLLGVGALALDGNNIFVGAAELQNAADAGALAGARELFDDEDGTLIRRGLVNTRAREAATANNARGNAVEVASVTVGHWSFETGGGGTFRAQPADPPADNFIDKSFSGDPSSCNNLNNFCSGDVNAVQVITERRGTPVQAFFGQILGFDGYNTQAVSVAYRGFSGSIEPEEVDQPIAICQESLLDSSGDFSQCSVGTFIPATTDTARWANLEQNETCGGAANASDLKSQVCAGGNRDRVLFGLELQTNDGQVNSAYSELYDCWEDRTEKTDPWNMVLPVIACAGNRPCAPVVGTVSVSVLWITSDPAKVADAPTEMGYVDPSLGSWSNTSTDGQIRWNDFVTSFGIVGLPFNKGSTTDFEYPHKTIFFAPDCQPAEPGGLTGVRNFGIRSLIPVLVN
ncbi:TadG family pilus assembly protein [Thiocapsa roseopersicina]|uniref:Putative Tad-like Flp pilus-assembly n=1 Tax=Thiocapsa roseopersicina TaxID=1058 RepID=A0A1H3CB83_THIRO|nr:TadG family pilus assembly protein [Thiocapsa roseopersicina]SDX51442.1 Putative Tad-like Flp pilus-assembly [Thiocapsa roseopersicina]